MVPYQQLSTTKPGELNGLILTLFIDQSEYIKQLAESAGVRVIVHDPTEMPFPENSGITVTPGQSSFVRFQLKTVLGVKSPHGNCKNFSKSENVRINSYWNELNNVSYSIEVSYPQNPYRSP